MATFRHLTIRLQLAWLTLVTCAAFILVVAFAGGGAAVGAHFASDLGALDRLLEFTRSVEKFNLFRAQLAADMMFLAGYGLLLRQSVVYHSTVHRRRDWGWRVALHAAVLTMAADATENLAALGILRGITSDAGVEVLGIANQQAVMASTTSVWLFRLMAGAAVVKWTSAALVMLFLANAWRRSRRAFSSVAPAAATVRRSRASQILAGFIAAAFGIGGTASLLVSLSLVVPSLRTIAASVALAAPALALFLQFRLLDLTGPMLRFLYLVRVPALALLFVAAFGPASLGPQSPLLGGILDVASGWAIAVIMASALVLVFACGTQINLVRAYGWQRTFDQALKVLRNRALTRLVFWTGLATASSLLFSIIFASELLTPWGAFWGLVLGTAAAFVLLLLVEFAAAWLAQDAGNRPAPQLAVPFRRIRMLSAWLYAVRNRNPPAAAEAVKRRIHRVSGVHRLFGLTSGYVEQLPSGTTRLLPGHTFALIQTGLIVTFYLGVMRAKSPLSFSLTQDPWVPTAAAIVLLILLVAWTLSALAFFLDRYRVPMLVAVLGAAMITSTPTWTDHKVRVADPRMASYPVATPTQVLSRFPQPIVVAAAGGGIQAGAWTARVLQGIDQRLRGEAAQLGSLRGRVALVSGVSGGALGALYFGAFHNGNLADATAAAMQPSLDDVASALIGVDLLRMLAVPMETDRGLALQRTWQLRLPVAERNATLGTWARRALQTDEAPFPAFLFNTTVVETGQPMAFATTLFPSAAYRGRFDDRVRQYPVVENAHTVFQLPSPAEGRHADIALPTAAAARLSAAFPYVSPASTLDVRNGQNFHLVDGGYYDNFGLVALSQWLDDALHGMARRPPAVHVVIIRGLVESNAQEQLEEGERAQNLYAGLPGAEQQGWAWQLTAPPSAFLNTRSFGQWAGGVQVLKLLQDKWDGQVAIRVSLFDFPQHVLAAACGEAPLSWKLSALQQNCIDAGWAVLNGKWFSVWNE